MLLIFSSASAQTKFQKVYGDSAVSDFTSYSIIQNPDSSIILIGRDLGKIVLIYTNKFGDTIRTKSYDNSSSGFYAIRDSVDNGMFIGGTSSLADNDIFFMKVDSVGDTLWTKRFGDTIDHIHYDINGICKTADGGFALCGTCYPSLAPQAIVLRIDSIGNIVWCKLYTNPSVLCRGESIQQTIDAGFIIGGFYSPDFLMIKTDSLGNILWHKTYNGPYINSIYQIDSSGYLMIGSTSDIYVAKTNNFGDLLWERCFGGSSNFEGALDVIKSHDNGFLICGFTNSFSADSLRKAYLIKINSSGGLQWSKTYHPSNVSVFYSLTETTDGYLAAGLLKEGNFSDTSFIYLIRTDQQGSTGCLDSAVNTISSFCNAVPTASGLSAISYNPLPYNPEISNGSLQINSAVLCHNIGIDELGVDKKISIYPNPFTNSLFVKFENGSSFPFKIKLFNSIGQKVFQKEFLFKENIVDVSILKPGVYFLEIRNSEGGVTKMLLK